MSRPTTKGYFVRERLIEARDARGLTQRGLANTIDRGESTISNWERGGQSPEPNALETLASALGVFPSYFLKEMPAYGGQPIFFRSLDNASARARTKERARLRWLQHISLVLQEALEFPSVDVPRFVVKDQYLNLNKTDLEHIATDMRAHWGLGEGPIPEMVMVAENAGVIVGVDEVGSTAIDGQGNWSEADNRPYILLARDKYTAYRRQMDVAHELAHIVLHRDLSMDQLEADFKLIEFQARYLAGALLLPHKAFAAEIPSLSLDGLLSLKRRWMTAVGAMIMRAEQLEIISSEAATSLWKYRATRGWHRREPFDAPNETAVEDPVLLRRSIELIVAQGNTDAQRNALKRNLLENDIALSGGDVEMLGCLPTGYFMSEPGRVVRFEPRLREAADVGPPSADIVPFRRPG